ncbi:hypothetical protein SAMN05660485_03682 [Blastococcus fimeti]|nr:hypothetical protein SAMN05660485_03682 [Blastococcus fimeti]
MPWWMWVGISLAWVLLAVGAALWLGASAKVVREQESRAVPYGSDESVDWEWRDVA